MPFVLQLNTALKQAGWKVKIHDYERLEPPHITVYQKMKKWRLSLRNGEFLDIGINGARSMTTSAQPYWINGMS